jgi:flagellar hook-basal body complex protein FliE
MDPLSAIRMFSGPAGGQGALPKGAMEQLQKGGLGGLAGLGGGQGGGGLEGLSKIIPENEMAQLKAFSKMADSAASPTLPPPVSTSSGNNIGLPSIGRVSGRDAFADSLGGFIDEVNAKQAAAGDSVRGLIGNQGVTLHQAMIAMEEASVSFQLMVEVRNKLLESYQELMRMQV